MTNSEARKRMQAARASNGPQIANLRPKVQALVMKYVAFAWNQGYRVGWDDRNQDDINPLPAGLFHDTPNPYEQEDGDV